MSADPQPPTSSPVQRLTANPALLLLAIVAVVALLAACIMGFLLLRPSIGGGDTNEPAAGEPTPFPEATAAIGSNQPVIVGVSDSGTYSVTLDAPATLGLLDQQRGVQPESIGVDGLWAPELSDENAAWVNGTIVNYVFGLPDTEANRALLESLAPGNEIAVTTRGGTTHTFAFDSRSQVPESDRSVFNQQAPGITLILLGGEDGERLVVRGRYEVAAADPGASSGNVIQLGETAQLGDAQITVQANSFLTNRPEAPPGFGFFLIDFVLQNVGLTAVDTSAYRFTLSDELGNQYALNPIASRLGNFPPLGGFVNAGQSVNATAGYQIPAGLVSPNLTWTVTAPDGAQIQAILPFTAGGQAGQSAVISLQEATITPDLNNLIIVGQVTNVGAQPLVITAEDISLRTPAGSDYLLLATNPPFPWTVPPNETLQFAVTYQRPIGSASAVFTILNQPFELSGLQ